MTPADAAVGQFFWATLHEVGHATFDILDVPIFGHEEDAADNFATYIMLQFGEGQAHRLINRCRLGMEGLFRGLQKNPVATRLAPLGAIMVSLKSVSTIWYVCHLEPTAQDLLILANYLPPTRAPGCAFEYRTLVRAFKKEISPHIDPEMARRVLDTNWLERLETEPLPQE